MTEKAFRIINNIFFAVFVIMSAYALARIYILNSSVPEGMCPVTNYRYLIYIAISIGIVSFVFSFLKKWLVK